MFFRTVLTCVLANTYSFQQNSKWNYNSSQIITVLRELCQSLLGLSFTVQDLIVTNSLGYKLIYIYIFKTVPD